MVIRQAFHYLLAPLLAVCLALLPAPAFPQSPAPQPAPAPAPAQPSPPPAPPPLVKRIEIVGNVRIPTEQILPAVTEMKVGEPLSDEKLRADVRAINELGWFADVSARLAPETGGVVVRFLVTENPTIVEIIVENNTAVASDEIRAALGVPIGDVLNLTKMREGARAVQKLYADKGFALARVADLGILPTERVDQARLRVRVAEGVVEAVRFDGLKKTQPTIAMRYVLETKPGGIFNLNVLQRDLQRLFDTGLFETIRARPEPGSTADSAVIVIEVKEARTASASFGLGYSSSEGLLGFIEYRDRNWQGQAQSFAVRAERAVQEGTTEQLNYEITFDDPFLDSLSTGLDLSLFSRDTIEREYDLSGNVTSRYSLGRDGGTVGVSRPLDGVTTGYVRLRSEFTTIAALPLDPSLTGPSIPCPPPPAPLPPGCPTGSSPGRVVSLQLSGVRDTRNSRLIPTSGDRLLASAELAPLWLGGQFDFTKYTVDYQRLFPTGGGAAFVARVFGGVASGSLPLQDRFVLGGPSTVRGLPSGFRRDVSMVVANAEYRFPLSGLIPSFQDVGMVFFVDSGAAPVDDMPQVGYGVGLTLNTPLGPIRIDLAWGPGGQRQTWLSLGAPF